MANGFIDEKQCTVTTPGRHGRVTIYNEAHNSGEIVECDKTNALNRYHQ